MSSHEVTPEEHARFVASYHGVRALTQKQEPKHIPPMTTWTNDRGQIVALVLHHTEGDLFYVTPQYDNRTGDATKDTHHDRAMRAATSGVVLVPQSEFDKSKRARKP